MVLKKYEKKDIRKSPKMKIASKESKVKAAPKKAIAVPEITKDGELWSFVGNGTVYSYTTKERAELRLEQFIEKAKRET